MSAFIRDLRVNRQFNCVEGVNPVPLLATALLLSLLLFGTQSFAFKVDVHVWIAQEVLNQITSQGKIKLTLRDATGKLKTIDVQVAPDRVAALKRFPEYFRMGSIGPDAYPDVMVGQMIIHPGNPHHWGSADWLGHLLESARTDEEKAFAMGALVHAASDVFAHTYVNRYAGETFDIGEHQEASLRHVKLESYISTLMPPLRDAAGQPIGLAHQHLRTSKGSLAIPADFLRAHLYFDSPVVDEIKYSGQAGYIPLIRTLKTNLDHAAKDGGLVDDLTTFGVQMAALIWGDIDLSKKDAEKLKKELQKIHGYAAFSDEFHQALIGVNKEVRKFHSFTEAETGRFFAATEKALGDMLSAKRDFDNQKQDYERKLFEWSQAPDGWIQDIVENTCKKCKKWSVGCRLGCGNVKRSIDHGVQLKRNLFNAKQDSFNKLHELEGELGKKQKSVHGAALEWMGAVGDALDTMIAINELQASYFSDEHSQDPLKFFIRNWNAGIDSSMSAFVVANGETIVNSITPELDQSQILKPYSDWFSCYGLAITSVPIQVTNGICVVKNGIEDIKARLDKVQGHIAALDPVSEGLFKMKKKFEDMLLDLRNDLISKGTDEITKQFDRAYDQRTNHWMKALTSHTDASSLRAEFAVDESNRSLPQLPDIVDRVQKELGSDKWPLDVEKFAVLRDSVVLSKVALLDQQGLNNLAAKAGLSYGVYGEKLYFGDSRFATNVIFGMARNIDGNHQWHEVSPPNPRQKGYDRDEYVNRHDDIEAGFSYRDPTNCIREQGMRMWVDPVARKKLFEKLFAAPLPAGVDLPYSLSPDFGEVLVEYPNTVTKENPWGNDGITLKADSYVRHAVLRGSAIPGTRVVIYRGNAEIARANVDALGAWSVTADIALSRTELLRFVVYRSGKPEDRPTGDTTVSYCTDQTDAQRDELVEVRTFVLIVKNDTLSRLARLLSGNSSNYVTIFKKNKHLIDDQNMIFVDQIFEVPGPKEWRFRPEGSVAANPPKVSNLASP